MWTPIAKPLTAVLASILLASSLAQAELIHLSLKLGKTRQKVAVATSIVEWEQWPMEERTPGIYSIDFEEPLQPSVEYKFVVNGEWMLDPENPRTTPDGGGGLNSVIPIRSFKEDPLLKPSTRTPAYRVTHLKVKDLEGDSRAITVISPAYPPESSVTVYFQDGGDYLQQTGAQWLLANLSAQRNMPSFVGVFIPPKDRMREYKMDPRYAEFVAKTVVSTIERKFPFTGGSREKRALIGPSLGGLITLYTALKHPDVFGNAASQSGSLWYKEGALNQELGKIVENPSVKLKIFMDVGTYEPEEMATFNRLGFAAAKRAGHDVTYKEYPSTHDWFSWRNRLQETFRYFFETKKRTAKGARK
jgi:enterochelin esterase-like enzyme